MNKKLFALSLALGIGHCLLAQNGDPKETEVWTPKPPVVTPGDSSQAAPSDAIVLFGGKNLDEWVSGNDSTKKAAWTVANGSFVVKKRNGQYSDQTKIPRLSAPPGMENTRANHRQWTGQRQQRYFFGAHR